MAKKPEFRAVVKTGEKYWDDIGAAWQNDDKIGVQLKFAPIPTNGKMSFLLVPNVPKATEE